MSNLLQAIYNIITRENLEVEPFNLSSIRANNQGEALEEFIRHAFASSFEISSEQEKLKTFADIFSWQGSQNHPPDLILKGSDAIEVKKSEGAGGANIPLNSSYPKSYLFRKGGKITEACQNCETEKWEKKDIIYALGNMQKSSQKLKSLWFIYGSLYCADKEFYERISNTITDGLNEIPDIKLESTNELGRVNKIDPLGITNLRIRGMWEIAHPNQAFKNILEEFLPSLKIRKTYSFEMIALLPFEKYESLDQLSKGRIEELKRTYPTFQQEILEIPNPSNPTKLIKSLLFYYCIK